MTLHAPTSKSPRLQRTQGRIEITTKVKPGGATGLNVLRQQGSSKAVFPRPSHSNLEAVLVNTAGGVTGGDRFDVSARATSGTSLILTTQAAERIYGAVAEQPGSIDTSLMVEGGAELCWLPQETILFNQSCLCRRLDVEVNHGGRFLMIEPLVFGRGASGEHLTSCTLSDSVSIKLEGRSAYLDHAKLSGSLEKALQRPAVGAGARAMCSLVLIDGSAAALLSAVREHLPQTGGASVLNDNTLVVRLLSADSYSMRQQLLPILKILTKNNLPKNWTL